VVEVAITFFVVLAVRGGAMGGAAISQSMSRGSG
jgi:hypothetical protein